MTSKNKKIFSLLMSLVMMLTIISTNATAVFAATKGDVNGDGALTNKDARAILNYALNSEFDGVENYDFSNADMDGDKMITATDAVKVKKVATPDNAPATLFVLGDSTGCDYAASADATYYYKRVGFGTRLGDYFTEELTVKNLALSGRSSKSFLAEPFYQTYLSELKEGDFVIIAFGHNDEKSEDSTRYTEPLGDKDTAGSFKNSLYVNYIQPALKAGATPIIATPVVRRTATGSWSDSNLHKANGGDYAQCGIDLAKELGLDCIDNTSLTKALYDELGVDKTKYLHAWTSKKETSIDNTHLNNYGASYVSYMMADAISKTDNKLANYVLDGIKAPGEEQIIVNPDYKEKVQTELVKSVLWNTTDPWWGSVFGDMGGQGKLNPSNEETGEYYKDQLFVNDTIGMPNFNIEEMVVTNSAVDVVTTGTGFNIRAGYYSNEEGKSKVNVGKIAGSTDGVAAVFRAVDSAINFSISAVANVNGVDNSNSQVTFGAVVFDNVDIDTYDGAAYDHIAAGPLKMKEAKSTATETNPDPAWWAGYGRIDGKLVAGSKVTGTVDERVAQLPKTGDKIPVKITKVGNEYTIEYNGIISKLTAEFKDDVYVGFFVSRCADVTFTDVVFNNEVSE